MAKIGVFVNPFAGPINAVRKLVRDLRARGHTVHYIGIADCQPHLEGEPFVAVFPNIFPLGTASAPSKSVGLSLNKRLRSLRRTARQARRFAQGLGHGRYEGFDLLVRQLNPDLFLVESTSAYFALLWGLLAHRFRIPTLLVNDSLTRPRNVSIPPMSSKSVPSGRAFGNGRTTLEWTFLATRLRLRRVCSRVVLGSNFASMLRNLAHAYNFPLGSICDHEMRFLRVRAPELFLMPEVFDFPHLAQPDRYYTAASVDLQRPECSFPWSQLDAEKPVIYCSLGTLSVLRLREYERFYRCVIEAFSVFSDEYQLVLSVGDHVFGSGALSSGTPNVTIVPRAPQIALLKRSVLMITHGGTNSLKECITLGVPMLLYPIESYDGFGLAARAVYHGLGLQGNIHRVTADEIRCNLKELLTIPYYRLQVRWMQNQFSRAEITQSPADLVDVFLGERHDVPINAEVRFPLSSHSRFGFRPAQRSDRSLVPDDEKRQGS